MARPAARARSSERVDRICQSTEDERTLRLRLLREMRQVVDFDAYAWLLTDPKTCVGTAPLADVPCLPELPRLIRLKYLTAVNRWTTSPEGSVGLLSEATGGELPRSLLWRELLCEYGVVDVASVTFRDRFGCWGFLDLWRSQPSPPFSPEDAGFLMGLAEPVTTALRRCQANSFVPRPPQLPRGVGPVVLLLSPELTVRAQTAETQQYLRLLVPPAGDQPPVPASAYNVAAQLLACEAGVDTNPPSARVHLSAGTWVTLRAARIGDDLPPGQSDIAVTIEESLPAERTALFARAFGFTGRETDLLRQLLLGSDTRELARSLSLSEHTVQDHLKSIFAKTSLHSRQAVLSRALGT